MLEILSLFLIVLVSTALGKKVFKLFKVKFLSQLDNFLFSLGLGLGALSCLVLALGCLGWLYPLIFYLLFIFFFVFLFKEIREIVGSFWEKAHHLDYSQLTLFEILLFIILGLHILFNLLVSLAPSIYWDELHYHLTAPSIFIQAHKISYLPFIPNSNYPLALEMLYTLGMLLRGDLLPALIHWLFGVLTVVGIYSFSRHYFNPRVALLSSSIFYATPVINWLSNIAYVDLGFTFYLLLSTFAFFNYLLKKEDKHLYLAAIFCGFSLSIKYSGVICLFLLNLGIGASFFLNRDKFLPYLKKMAIFSIISLLVASPWYLKNFVFTGNPVYPFLGSFFGGIEVKASKEVWQSIIGFGGRGKGIRSLLLLPWNITIYGQYFAGLIGPIFLSFIPLLLFFRGVERKVKYLLVFSGLYFLFWFFSSQQSRFLLPGLATLGIGIAWLTEQLRRKDRYWECFIALIMIATFIFNFYLLSYAQSGRLPVALHLESKDHYLSSHLNTYEAFKFIDKELPLSSKIFIANDNRGYYCNRSFIYNIFYQTLFTPENSAEVRYKRLKDLGVTHLLLNMNLYRYSPKICSLVEEDLRKGYLKPIYARSEVYLFRVGGRKDEKE